MIEPAIIIDIYFSGRSEAKRLHVEVLSSPQVLWLLK